MLIALTVLEVVAPVFILAAIGFAWVKAGFDYDIAFVTRLAMTLSVPCLIFTALVNTKISPDALSATFYATILTYAAVTAVMWVILKIARLDLQTYWAPLIFGNTGNLGLPLALFAFGEVGLGYAVVVFALMGIYSFTVGIWMVSGRGAFTRAAKEPLVGATILGLIFMLQGWSLPTWVDNTLGLVGQMAIPLMLLTLGVALARLQLNSVWRGVVLAVLKVIVCSGLATSIGMWMGLQPIALAVLIVQVSTPVAVTSYLLAQKYGAAAPDVAGMVVISTLLSVLYLPIILAFVM